MKVPDDELLPTKPSKRLKIQSLMLQRVGSETLYLIIFTDMNGFI